MEEKQKIHFDIQGKKIKIVMGVLPQNMEFWTSHSFLNVHYNIIEIFW